jgi:cardiolipin-specific phospholipase
MKYPSDQMKALILISPAGLADHPPVEHQIPSSKLSTPIRLIDVMWSSNFTPQQIVRLLGPKGPNTVRDVVKRRFGSDRWNESDSALIADYLYHITAAPASGEYAMNSILQPIISKKVESLGPTEGQKSRKLSSKNDEEEYSTSVYAREPVTPRAFSLSYQSQKTNTSSLFPRSPPPILLLYGDHDWLRFPGMERYVKEMNEDYRIPTELKIVSSAGHHLYLDNTKQFHTVIENWLDSNNIK